MREVQAWSPKRSFCLILRRAAQRSFYVPSPPLRRLTPISQKIEILLKRVQEEAIWRLCREVTRSWYRPSSVEVSWLAAVMMFKLLASAVASRVRDDCTGTMVCRFEPSWRWAPERVAMALR